MRLARLFIAGVVTVTLSACGSQSPQGPAMPSMTAHARSLTSTAPGLAVIRPGHQHPAKARTTLDPVADVKLINGDARGRRLRGHEARQFAGADVIRADVVQLSSQVHVRVELRAAVALRSVIATRFQDTLNDTLATVDTFIGRVRRGRSVLVSPSEGSRPFRARAVLHGRHFTLSFPRQELPLSPQGGSGLQWTITTAAAWGTTLAGDSVSGRVRAQVAHRPSSRRRSRARR